MATTNDAADSAMTEPATSPTDVPSAIDLPLDSEHAPASENPSEHPPNVHVPPGPPKPQVDAQGRPLNPRSCVTCRKRKVRCDKVHPCNHCSRAHIECVFPSPGRAPRKARKVGEGRDKELLERLRRLEGVVKGLGVDVPDGKDGIALAIAGGAIQAGNAARTIPRSDELASEKPTLPREPQVVGLPGTPIQDKKTFVEEQQGRFENRFGRLVINEGKSRYINSSFWANLSNEVEDLKGILNQSSDEEDVHSPGSDPSTGVDMQGWIFGFSSQSVDLLSLHPIPGQIEHYWAVYKDRVDPLVKVLHIPTTEPTVLSAASYLSNLSKGFEVLLFTIYYGAVTSLSVQDCRLKFGEDKTVLLARYRFAIEQALARANFLTTEETVVLQAFVIFLICLRRNSDARVIWTLTGLVVRIAQTLGIHRDGAHFGLAPFQIEMRRRLWWQVCLLDIRASEDHGCDPTIVEQSFDTKMPLNINDVDISPDMKVLSPERRGCTDISFCLIRFEVSNTFRRINYVPPGPSRAYLEHYASVTLQEKEKWITECHEKLEERYLKHCDMNVPLFWVTATVARLMMSKMWLMVYHPFQRQDGGASLPAETKEKLFITSLENIEYALLLETEARTMKWGWLFKTYMQWHALAFMLSELCHRTSGDLVERAWIAVEKTRDGRWGPHTTGHNSRVGHLWRPLKKLYRKAKDARQRGLQEEELIHPRAAQPPARLYSPNANPMFGHPNRPRVVRAPLSQAQLQRFAQGPTFGQMPLDKHELLKSPRVMQTTGATEIDPIDIASVQMEGVQPSLPPGFVSNTDGANPNAPAMQTVTSYTNGVGDTDFGFTDLTHPTTTMGAPLVPTTSNTSAPPRDPVRLDSVDSTGFDFGAAEIMDTPGDLNWENWDQLVRQFGMAVDHQPTSVEDLGHAKSNWNGAGWEMGGNLRMGMGGGDWF